MKAVTVNEFQRGMDPKKALGLGDHNVREYMKNSAILKHLVEGDDFTIEYGKLYIKKSYLMYDFVKSIQESPHLAPNFKINVEDYITNDEKPGYSNRSFHNVNLYLMERLIDEKTLSDDQLSAYLFFKLHKRWEGFKHFKPSAEESLETFVDTPEVKTIMEDLIDMHGWEGLPKKFKYLNSDILLKLLKKFRSEDKAEEEEIMKPYIFISTPVYKEVKIDGETYHKKHNEIENLYQVDPYSKSSDMALFGMRMRLRYNHESQLWMVKIPTDIHDKETAYDREISPQLRKYIEANKKKI